MKEELRSGLEAVRAGNMDAAEPVAAQLKQLARRDNGLFELTEVEDNLFQAARVVYPVYAAYETERNKKEGYPDLLAQLRLLREELKKAGGLADTAAFLDALICTLDFVSPQLYEYYRELEELFRETVREAVQVFYLDGHFREADGRENREAEKLLQAAIAHASDRHVLLGEKYERFSGACAGRTEVDGVPGKQAFSDSGTAEAGENGVPGKKLSSDPVGRPAGESRDRENGDGHSAAGTEIRLVCRTARNAVIEIADGGRYFTKRTYRVFVNGEEWAETDRVITSLYGLKPDRDYVVEVLDGEKKVGRVCLRTDYEFVTLNVRDFGARGDGVQDDTHFIQAAIMACPTDSRVLIPAGTYRITSLFLKSHIRLELARGAELKAFTEKEKFPVFPGIIQSYDETDQYNPGSWEGNPLPMYTALICGVGVEDVVIYGEGTINGNASKEDWWKNVKAYKGVFRPRLFFINGCKNVTLQGVTCCNSPAWTLHPYFSDDLGFIDLNIKNPSDSPNTDGLDPESCKNVEILGVRFSLGDDCIAVKSGKIYMGKKYKRPSENIRIRQCLMEDGHGAVTLGSEMAGGIVNLTVEDCIFRHTDRGLRIKTRRGRGKDAILDHITFRNLDLDHVMTPLVVNSFYFCDPDGRTPYVQSREAYPADDRTPSVRRLVFENMRCVNCHVAAAFFDGLPEQKIQEIVMKNISFRYAEEPRCDVPAMSEGVPKSSRRGLFARNVAKLTLENVTVEGQDGEAYEFVGVDELLRGN